MGRIGIEIDTEFIKQLTDVKEDIDLAARRTIKRVAEWLKIECAKQLSQNLNIKISVSKRRFKAYSSGDVGKLWVGVDKINYYNLGIPTPTDSGVDVNGESLDHAFIDPMFSSKLLVWRRKSKNRLPIDPVKKDIKKEAEKILRQYQPRTNAKFKEIFNKEIKHAI